PAGGSAADDRGCPTVTSFGRPGPSTTMSGPASLSQMLGAARFRSAEFSVVLANELLIVALLLSLLRSAGPAALRLIATASLLIGCAASAVVMERPVTLPTTSTVFLSAAALSVTVASSRPPRTWPGSFGA